MNPHYDADKLGLTQLTFDQPDLSYEYDTLNFWAIDGKVFTAHDSGCSCPTPFEEYSADTVEKVLQGLERVGSLEQALATFDSWNKGYDDKPKVGHSERKELSDWINQHLKA